MRHTKSSKLCKKPWFYLLGNSHFQYFWYWFITFNPFSGLKLVWCIYLLRAYNTYHFFYKTDVLQEVLRVNIKMFLVSIYLSFDKYKPDHILLEFCYIKTTIIIRFLNVLKEIEVLSGYVRSSKDSIKTCTDKIKRRTKFCGKRDFICDVVLYFHVTY